MKLINLLLGSGIFINASALNLSSHWNANEIRHATAQLQLEIDRTRIELDKRTAELDVALQELGRFRNVTLTLATQTGFSAELSLLPFGEAGWDPNIPFIDLPKWILDRNGVIILNGKAEVTPDAGVLFSLTPDQRQAIQNVYRAYEERVQEIERACFKPTDQHIAEFADRPEPKLSFRLHSFTNEMENLLSEWQEELGRIAGPTRAKLLTEHIRRPRDSLASIMVIGNSLPWPNRGAEEHLTILFRTRSDGRPAWAFHVRSGENNGSNSGPASRIPERWRHLITEEMLQLPE
jgi:hypothetical protein